MIQKLEILDKAFDVLDEINNKHFSSEKFKEVNSKIEDILISEMKNKKKGDCRVIKQK